MRADEKSSEGVRFDADVVFRGLHVRVSGCMALDCSLGQAEVLDMTKFSLYLKIEKARFAVQREKYHCPFKPHIMSLASDQRPPSIADLHVPCEVGMCTVYDTRTAILACNSCTHCRSYCHAGTSYQ